MTASATSPTPAAIKLGRTVRQARLDTGFSQRDLAERVNYSHVMIHRLEAGKWPISSQLMRDVADALASDDRKIEWHSLWDAANQEAESESARLRFERESQRSGGRRRRRYFPLATDGQSIADFQKALLRLRRSTGNPSYQDMARRSEKIGHPVSRTALNSLVQPGRRELRFETVTVFLEVCGVSGAESDIWMDLYAQLPVNQRRSQRNKGEMPSSGETTE